MVITDIDHRVKYYIQRILSSLPGDEVLNIFKRLHASPASRHQAIVRCMSKHLVAEFQVFPYYPKSELFKIANFVGGFLEHELISDENTLSTIVGYIFYNLKSGSANAFNFSLAALKRFQMKLKNFPNFCYRLQKVDDFKNFPSDLIEYIEYGTDGLEPSAHQKVLDKPTLLSAADNKEKGTESQNVIVHAYLRPTPEPPAATVAATDTLPTPEPPATNRKAPAVAFPTPEPLAVTTAVAEASPAPEPLVVTTAVAEASPAPEPLAVTTAVAEASPTPEPLAVTTAVAEASPAPEPEVTIKAPADVRPIAPSKDVQGKVRSIINRLGKANPQAKVEEIKNLIADEHLPWLSRYIVAKRVRHEFNLHHMYSRVLDCFDSEQLDSLILMDTLSKVRILLRRNEGIPSVSDKWLIKNLGHWLGVITLARNRPIAKEDIDLEHLLAEGYANGEEELLFVIQFVTNILESCSAGKFGMDNPWTTSIINILFELYEKPNTKLRVQVEIEKLCKKLSIKRPRVNQ